jgi:hypothetical protein
MYVESSMYPTEHIFLHNLKVPELVKKFPALYG